MKETIPISVEHLSSGKIFSPQNWIKAKTCLSGIRIAVSTQLMMLPMFLSEKELKGTWGHP
jgi:uncharacterized Fe-S cluster-containing MiaB family protein